MPPFGAQFRRAPANRFVSGDGFGQFPEGLRIRVDRFQLDLRRDIEKLETRLKIINTAGVPVLLCVLALSLGGYRGARRRADRRRGSDR